MHEVRELILNLLYPPKCMLCRRLMDSWETPVCGRCGLDLPEYDGPLPKVKYFEKAVAPFYYEEPIRGAILRLKYHGLQTYARQFAQWMAIWVRDRLEGQYDLISWVPCSRRRQFSRGYNQAELLARALAEELGVEAMPTLRKIRHNPQQAKTRGKAQRQANVLGAYAPREPEHFRNKRILLVDDVLTTGSTLSECGKVLRIAGSGDLVCAVVAVTRSNTKESSNHV